MANFWDLPKLVREEIYRLHLVEGKNISGSKHRQLIKYVREPADPNKKGMPPICSIAQKAEKEAAPIYYGENHFEFIRDGEAFNGFFNCFTHITYTRHLRLVRTMTLERPADGAREVFLSIAGMRGLRELNIQLDEVQMVNEVLGSRYDRQRGSLHDNPTPQEQIAILRYPGMTGLLSVSGVPDVRFLKRTGYRGAEFGGPIPGGFMETQVRPKLMVSKSAQAAKKSKHGAFPFLSLPPELRNRIYCFLLGEHGEIHPSVKPPSSTLKKNNRRHERPPGTTLNLLCANRQIHDEAVGIFYHSNSFEFYYPTQLHAFLLSLGNQRQSFIRDVTIQYYNYKCGGIDLAPLTFAMLKQLTGLRRLHVYFPGTLMDRMRSKGWYWRRTPSVYKANPTAMPGIKHLFALRGIPDIELRDTELDDKIEALKKDKSYPNFPKESANYNYMRLSSVLEHVNAAFADAQQGKINKKLLEDDEWHMKDVFPTLDKD